MKENIKHIRLASQLIEYKQSTNREQNISILLVNVEKLSELLSRRLKELKLSNADLARLTGLSRSYIGNMVNETAPTQSGQYQPSPDVVAKLSQHLKVTEAEILNSVGFNIKIEVNDSPFFKAVRGELNGSDSWEQERKELFLTMIKTIVSGLKVQTVNYEIPDEPMKTIKQDDFIVEPTKKRMYKQSEFIVEQVDDGGTINIDKKGNRKAG